MHQHPEERVLHLSRFDEAGQRRLQGSRVMSVLKQRTEASKTQTRSMASLKFLLLQSSVHPKPNFAVATRSKAFSRRRGGATNQ